MTNPYQAPESELKENKFGMTMEQKNRLSVFLIILVFYVCGRSYFVFSGKDATGFSSNDVMNVFLFAWILKVLSVTRAVEVDIDLGKKLTIPYSFGGYMGRLVVVFVSSLMLSMAFFSSFPEIYKLSGFLKSIAFGAVLFPLSAAIVFLFFCKYKKQFIVRLFGKAEHT